MDGAGNLYGTTSSGGGNGRGVVFQVTPDEIGTAWNETVLYSFCSQTNCADGAGPLAGLIMDSAGDLYGTTTGGGNGDAFLRTGACGECAPGQHACNVFGGPPCCPDGTECCGNGQCCPADTCCCATGVN
jgi:uncharacterized repeat protein (TIGR03803 family)